LSLYYTDEVGQNEEGLPKECIIFEAAPI